VLKLPDIPAVINRNSIHIQSPRGKLLKQSSFQKKLATSIASSVGEYLSDTAAIPQSEEPLKR